MSGDEISPSDVLDELYRDADRLAVAVTALADAASAWKSGDPDAVISARSQIKQTLESVEQRLYVLTGQSLWDLSRE